eukprot:474267-Alexandrium_andersonii.AAC.1
MSTGQVFAANPEAPPAERLSLASAVATCTARDRFGSQRSVSKKASQHWVAEIARSSVGAAAAWQR